MCSRGVWQLQKLTVRYCGRSGASAGVREFIKDHAATFARENPHLTVAVTAAPNKDPILVGEYLSGAKKQIDVKNRSSLEVKRFATFLRNQSGHKVVLAGRPVRTDTPSIQGLWDTSTGFDKFGLRV